MLEANSIVGTEIKASGGILYSDADPAYWAGSAQGFGFFVAKSFLF